MLLQKEKDEIKIILSEYMNYRELMYNSLHKKLKTNSNIDCVEIVSNNSNNINFKRKIAIKRISNIVAQSKNNILKNNRTAYVTLISLVEQGLEIDKAIVFTNKIYKSSF